MDFVVGDTVKLRSGGAMMTVEAVDEDGVHVECVWHEKVRGKTEATRGTFVKATLEKASNKVVGVVSTRR